MLLSVVMPAYDERATISAAIADVVNALPGVPRELVIVDDGSRDGTREWLTENVGGAEGRYGSAQSSGPDELTLAAATGSGGGTTLRLVLQPENRGKGAAIRAGLAAASGDVLVIHDADREYDPGDWERMYALIAERKLADVVIGSRFYGNPHRSLYFHHYLANRFLSVVFNFLYNQTLTDIEVCTKMFTRSVLETLRLSCDDFGVEVQMCAQISRARRWRIYETGVSYHARTYREGKKIDWRDGVKALWYLIRFRLDGGPKRG